MKCKSCRAKSDEGAEIYCASCYEKVLEENVELHRQVGNLKAWARSWGNRAKALEARLKARA